MFNEYLKNIQTLINKYFFRSAKLFKRITAVDTGEQEAVMRRDEIELSAELPHG